MRDERSSFGRDPVLRSIFLFFHLAMVAATPPTPLHYLSHAFTSLAYVAFLEGLHARNQPRVLDHKRHKLRGVAANVEVLEAILFDEFLECAVRGEADTVAVAVLEDEA
jgi:hypothetical protein